MPKITNKDKKDIEILPRGKYKTIPINEIKINKKIEESGYQMPDKDYNEIKSSIKQHGITDPIKLNQDYEIVDGHNRYKIAKQLKLETVPVIIKTYDDPLEQDYEVTSSNLLRKFPLTAQRAKEALKLLEIERKLGKKRQKASLPKKGQKGFNVSPDLDSHKTGNSLDIVAKTSHLSRGTLAKTAKLEKASKDNPEIKKDFEDAQKGIGTIDSVYNKHFHKKKSDKDIAVGVEISLDEARIVIQRKTLDDLFYIMDHKKGFVTLDEIIEYLIHKSKYIRR